MGVGLRADVQRVRHRVGIQRAWIEDRDPGRGHREDRLPPGPRPGPDEDRRTPAGTSRPAWLWRRRVQRRGRRASYRGPADAPLVRAVAAVAEEAFGTPAVL